MHRNWILKLTKLDLPALQSFSIHLYLDDFDNILGCVRVLIRHQMMLTSLDKLDSLRVYGSEIGTDWNDGTGLAFDGERRLGCRFDAGMNWMTPVQLTDTTTRGLLSGG